MNKDKTAVLTEEQDNLKTEEDNISDAQTEVLAKTEEDENLSHQELMNKYMSDEDEELRKKNAEILDVAFADDAYSRKLKKKQEKKERKKNQDKTSAGIKFVAVISLIIAIAGMAFAAVFVMFVVNQPTYDKTAEVVSEVSYPALETMDSSNDGMIYPELTGGESDE